MADPLFTSPFSSETISTGEWILTPVTGYEIPSGEAGSFLAEDGPRAGYLLTLNPGQAVLYYHRQPVETEGAPFVVTV